MVLNSWLRGRAGLWLVAAWLGLFAMDPVALAEDQQGALRRNTLVEDGEALGVGRLIADLELAPLRGEETSLRGLLQDRKGAVIAITSATCPVSKKYAPRLASLEREFSQRGLAFVYVNAVDIETEAEIVEQIRDQGFQGPYLPDRDGKVVRALGARSTAEVYLLDAARTLVYRGAVDDQYGVGTIRPAPRRSFLRDAIEALLSGQRQRIRATWAPGCLIDQPDAKPQAISSEITYSNRISRILVDKCITCHRLGGDAPFSFEKSSDLRARSSMIEAVIADGLMPPWHASSEADSPTAWANHRDLSRQEREDLLTWLRAGMPMGSSGEAPELPPLPPSWWIGRPDLVLSSPTLELPEEGPMEHARMLVDTGLSEDRWVDALELRPLKNDTVHHAVVWVLPPGQGLPRLDEIPSNLELLGTFSPGDGRVLFEKGIARKLQAGSLLVVDFYGVPMGKIMHARMRVGLSFQDEAPEYEVRIPALACEGLTIPADDAEVRHAASVVLEESTRLAALWPYMRARGKALRVDAHLPDGNVVNLLDAARFDYRWQIRYEFVEPLRLPAGTRIELSGHHDNSPDNPNNPAGGRATSAGPGVTQDALLVGLEILERHAPAGKTER